MIKTGFSVMMPFLIRFMHSFISELPPFSVDAVGNDIQCRVDSVGDGSGRDGGAGDGIDLGIIDRARLGHAEGIRLLAGELLVPVRVTGVHSKSRGLRDGKERDAVHGAVGREHGEPPHLVIYRLRRDGRQRVDLSPLPPAVLRLHPPDVVRLHAKHRSLGIASVHTAVTETVTEGPDVVGAAQPAVGRAEKVHRLVGDVVAKAGSLVEKRGDGGIDLLEAFGADSAVVKVCRQLRRFVVADFADECHVPKPWVALLALKEAPMRILFLLSSQFQRLMIVKSMTNQGFGNKEIALKAGCPEWAVRKYQSQSRAFSMDQLKQAIRDGVEYETAVKTGHMNDQMAVELFLVQYSAGK